LVKSKVWLSLVALILTTVFILAGCTSSKTPQEALKTAMTKTAEMKSYSFNGSLKVEDLTLPAAGTDAQSSAAMLGFLKNMDITWKGVYRADPMLMEMTMSIAIKGDLAINFNIPVVINKDKIWVKIPNIPMLGLPETVVGKFLELDLKKLAEQSGQPIPTFDPAKSQQFVNDILAIIFKNVDEKQYLSEVKVKDAGLPDGTDVKQLIRFTVNKDQVEPFVNTVVDKIAPEIMDLLSKKAEYRDMLGLKQEDLDQAKKDLEAAKKEDIAKGMTDFKKTVKSLDLTANIGIDAKDYPVYNDFHVKSSFDLEGQTGSVALKVVSQLQDINKEAKFQIGEPKDVITMEQFDEQMGGLFGTSMDQGM
jgi:hypothetical protein